MWSEITGLNRIQCQEYLRWTPMHIAASENQIDLLRVMFDLLKKNQNEEKERGISPQMTTTQVWNLEDRRGYTPVFCSTSAEVVKEFLHQIPAEDDLKTVLDDGMTLLYHCASEGIVDEVLLSHPKMKEHLMNKWAGELPIDVGELEDATVLALKV